ncbi:MAG: alkaline phosphatase family protein [Acuticoccus sp.]
MVPRAIVLILDGLRRDLVSAETTPHLAAFAAEATRFANHRSVFPSATRVVSAAFSTGCLPAKNGLHGNTVALMTDEGLALFDVGKPEFMAQKRALTGHTLLRPTMAERLAERGGVLVYNNVSPGAAYAHDPDAHGTVYHRAGSRGPGFAPVAEPLDIKIGIDGDKKMARRFIAEAVDGDAALSVLWLSEPDTTQHAVPLGSPDHLAVLKKADAIAGRVITAVRERGEDTLLLVGSDHGHQTVTRVIDINAFLVCEGLKTRGANDVLVAPNGTGALIYVHPAAAGRIPAMLEALGAVPWVDALHCGAELEKVGHCAQTGPAIAIAMAASDAPNEHGIRGLSAAARPAGGKSDRLGCGQHGGLGTFEQSPFLAIAGRGFAPGTVRVEATSIVDLAPTVLAHLGVAHEALDGRDLHAPVEFHGDQRP